MPSRSLPVSSRWSGARSAALPRALRAAGEDDHYRRGSVRCSTILGARYCSALQTRDASNVVQARTRNTPSLGASARACRKRARSQRARVSTLGELAWRELTPHVRHGNLRRAKVTTGQRNDTPIANPKKKLPVSTSATYWSNGMNSNKYAATSNPALHDKRGLWSG